MNEEAFRAMLERRKADKAAALAKFPKPGAKLRYRGAHQFWFTDIMALAERELQFGQIYTLSTIELASSWVCITLEETGDHEFPLSFFDELSNDDRND